MTHAFLKVRLTCACGALCAAALLLPSAPARTAAAQASDDPVASARNTVEQWVEVRRLISVEQQQWLLGRELLEDRIKLVRREIEAVRARIGEASAGIAEAETRRDALVLENEEAKTATQSLARMIPDLEASTLELIQRFPDPLQSRIEPLAQRVPTGDAPVRASLAERYQNIVGMLNEANRFNRELSIVSEVRELPTGGTAEVTTLYLGIGWAWFVGANGRVAAMGKPSADGWIWQSIDPATADVARAIAMYRGEEVAGFVTLPVQMQETR